MSASTTIELVPVSHENPPLALGENSQQNESTNVESAPDHKIQDKGKTAFIIVTIAGVTTISSLLSGLVTISLPDMAKSLNIPPGLLFWPASVYSLACGCTLILAGTTSDVIGARNVYLLGTLFQSVFTLACGLAKTSTQLIIFRALAGVAISLCLPSAVSLIISSFPAGRRRNLAFGIMGGGQPLGFTIGLVAGGGLTDSAGWQAGFYLAAAINSVLLVLAFFVLPKVGREGPLTLERLKKEVDWVGALILSSSLALLLYVFATWTGNLSRILSSESISCLTLGLALLPAFALWMHRQEKLGHAVLIRNSLWWNKAFTSICINVFLIWGSFNATEVFLTFLFQDVQKLSATAASIRFLPEPVIGATINILIGLYVHRMRANWTLVASYIASAVSPLLLAIMRRGASYWEYEFPAVALVPVASDVLYTISQLVITAEFDEKTQGLAGGVFNTIAQIGKSVGIALSAVVASSITTKMNSSNHSVEERLLEGYRGAWWFTFASTITCIFVTFWGMRNITKVGVKKE